MTKSQDITTITCFPQHTDKDFQDLVSKVYVEFMDL